MRADGQFYLIINGGSSSIKFALFDAKGAQTRRLSGEIERIGLANPRFSVMGPEASDNFAIPAVVADHAGAVALLIDWVRHYRGSQELAAIGHRIVHGGSRYSQPERVTAQMLAYLLEIQAFDPVHLPEEIALMQAFHDAFPALPQVACFDTSFHTHLPRLAQMLAIPRRFEALGVRRYGFHGLSYQFLMEELARLAGEDVANGRIILAHLGSGASLAAVNRRQSVETSMGFTPASGIMMGTRSGDLDPGLMAFLARNQNINAADFDDMVNLKSGLLGISQTSSDMTDLLAQEGHDVRSAEAVALFCYQIRKCIGAFTAVLGGVDQLVFSGGIGEHAAIVRERICEGLGYLGIVIDPSLNGVHAPLISAQTARVPVRIIHTDEERVIAKAMLDIFNAGASG